MKKIISPEEMMQQSSRCFHIGDRVKEVGSGKLGYVRESSYGNLFQFEADDGTILQPHQLITVVPIEEIQ